jgi:hypothetical protein
MIEISHPFGVDPSIVLASAREGGLSAADAGGYFVTREADYVFLVPRTHEAAVRAALANPPLFAPDLIPQEVTETQFIRATVRMGIITADEGKAYLGRGELPAMMQVAIDKLPEPARTDAMLKAIGSASFSRNDGVFKAIVAAGVATDEHIDAVFKLAGSLE